MGSVLQVRAHYVERSHPSLGPAAAARVAPLLSPAQLAAAKCAARGAGGCGPGPVSTFGWRICSWMPYASCKKVLSDECLNRSIVTRARAPRQPGQDRILELLFRELGPARQLGRNSSRPVVGGEGVVCRGAWARVTIGRFRHSALSTLKKHRASTNIFLTKC